MAGRTVQFGQRQREGHVSLPPDRRYFGRNASAPDGRSSQPMSQPVTCAVCGGRGHLPSACPSAKSPSRNEPRPQPRTPLSRGRVQPPKKAGIIRNAIVVNEDYTAVRNEAGENFKHYEKLLVRISDDTFVSQKLDSFEQANLDGALMDVIRKYNYQTPTPIQKYAIPVIADGRDLVATCETGSGKTAAFLLPLANSLIRMDEKVRQGPGQAPLAVVVVPTRELTEQLVKDAKDLLRRTDIVVRECYGGTDFGKQKRNVERGTQVLIGTLGRIMAFLEQGIIVFSRLRHLVLDEADQMLREESREEITKILSLAREARPQVLMFSATFPNAVLDVAETYLQKDYVKISVGLADSANEDVEQKIIEVTENQKFPTLVDIIKASLEKDPQSKILVFVKQKSIIGWLEGKLAKVGSFTVSSLHSDRTPEQRQEAVSRFQAGDLSVLVASSVADRGLDIRRVTLVINYDLPKTLEAYINRIGRTGRVGNRGLAIAFFDPSVDFGLAADLRKCLVDAGETPPDFLAQVAINRGR